MSVKQGVGRRVFLRNAAGVAVALPLLEMSRGHSRAAGGALRNFVMVFSHGGAILPRTKSGSVIDGNGDHNGIDRWTPTGGATLGVEHAPLAAAGLTDKCLLLRGIDNMSGNRQAPYGGGEHGWSNKTVLTCADLADTVGDSADRDKAMALGPSFDAALAPRLQSTPLVHLYVPATNYSSVEYGTPFFRAARQPGRGTSNPKTAFDQLFAGVSDSTGGTVMTGPDPAALKANRIRQSILNGTMEGFNRLRGRASARDRAILDAHFDHLRTLELEVEAFAAMEAGTQVVPACNKSEAGQGTGTSNAPSQLIGPLQSKLVAAAIRCGITRVANLEITDLLTDWLPGFERSVAGEAHNLGHLARDTGPTGPYRAEVTQWTAEIVANRQWRMSLVAELAKSLEEAELLDETVILYTSEFSDASQHSSSDLPVLLVGGGNHFRTGRVVNFNTKSGGQYATTASMHNLFTSLFQAMGEPDTHFGNDRLVSKGPLAGLV